MRTAPKSGATIVDIARKLKVSAMTVSRALSGSSEVSAKTRERVVRCAAELGYRPNRWARSLVTSKSAIVGVVVPDIAHSYFAEITRGIEEVFEKAGYDLLLCHSGMDAAKERSAIDMLVSSRVEGLIVATEQPEKTPDVFVALRERRIPFVLIDRYYPSQGFHTVRVDDRKVGRLATGHLIELGHRRIAHIQGPPISPAIERHRGYRESLAGHGLAAEASLVVEGQFDIESGRRAMQTLLALKPRPTAVFAANDPMAVGAIHACRDAGLAIPGDISIIGAGNIEGAHHPFPFLSTIDWPRVDFGRAAATFLIAAIRNPDLSEARVETFEPALLRRQSTGPPAAARPAR